MSIEPKKLALLRILDILKKESDFCHPLKQEEIATKLSNEYGIDLERKAISRNLSLLKEAGYEILSDKRGSWLDDRGFEDSELRMLIDGVLSSKYVSEKYSKDLIEKLCSLSNKYFRSHVKNIYSVNDWSKTQNKSVFYNVDIIDEAIEKGKQIKFNYNKFGIDKKLHKTAEHLASPYQLILKNQRYYLMALNEKWKNMGYYRLDHITDIELTDLSLTPIREVDGFKSGIDYKKLSSALPYMYADNPQRVEFIADPSIIDQIIEWFGYDIKIEKQNDKIKVVLSASLYAMEYWAMQYLNFVEITYPQTLRNKIKQNVQAATEKYNAN